MNILWNNGFSRSYKKLTRRNPQLKEQIDVYPEISVPPPHTTKEVVWQHLPEMSRPYYSASAFEADRLRYE